MITMTTEMMQVNYSTGLVRVNFLHASAALTLEKLHPRIHWLDPKHKDDGVNYGNSTNFCETKKLTLLFLQMRTSIHNLLLLQAIAE
jgi:hypothetical protein